MECGLLWRACHACRVARSPFSLVPLSPCPSPPPRLHRFAGEPGHEAADDAGRPGPRQPWYWYNRPAAFAVDYPQFDPLWRAAGEAVRDAGFTPDRQDMRNGVMTTRRLVSQQIFEPWRRDTASPTPPWRKAHCRRCGRTVRFEFARKEDGTYRVDAEGAGRAVLVRRAPDHLGRRVPPDIRSSRAKRPTAGRTCRKTPTQEVSGTPPPEYWYAIGRDADMEQRLAEWVRDRLQSEHGPKVVVTGTPATQPSGS